MDAAETVVSSPMGIAVPESVAQREVNQLPETRRPGRPVGSVNNTTRQVREALAKVAVDGAEAFWGWLSEIDDPYKRADLYLKAVEYTVPRLARTELTGAEGGPVQHTYRWLDEGEVIDVAPDSDVVTPL